MEIKRTAPLMKEHRSFVSLYSGCGGIDLGFERAGFACGAAFDNNLDAVNTHNMNFAKKAFIADLNIDNESVKQAIGRAEILVAGPPCQGFSTAGYHNPDDQRNIHLLNTATLAAQCLPKFVIIENVRGLLAKKYSEHLQRTLNILSSAGYSVSYNLYDLSDYGVAQSRKRVIIFGRRDGNTGVLDPVKTKAVTLGDILCSGPLQNSKPLASRSLTDRDQEIARNIRPGQKLSNVRQGPNSVHTWDIPSVFGKTDETERQILNAIVLMRRRNRAREFGDADPVSSDEIVETFGLGSQDKINSLETRGFIRRIGTKIDLRNTFNGKYRRLDWKDVSPTVDTRFTQPRYFLHPDEDRGFTIREMAALQGFPLDFQFEGAESSVARMIGNAVPPPFAKAIAEALRRTAP